MGMLVLLANANILDGLMRVARLLVLIARRLLPCSCVATVYPGEVVSISVVVSSFVVLVVDAVPVSVGRVGLR